MAWSGAWILAALSLAYAIPILAFAWGFARLRSSARRAGSPPISGESTSVTIVVAARNEAENIRACLEAILAQDMGSAHQPDVMVVDDHSTDDTAAIVASFGDRVRLIRLVRGEGKKAGITEAVRQAESEWLLLTDADTIAPPGWARSMMRWFTEENGFVQGPVRLPDRKGWFHEMVRLEWAGFMGIAAGAVSIGRPISACGSSVAFRKEAFEAVNGYEGVDHLISGDDEFLMQRIADRSRWNVAFCQDREAIVVADAPDTAAAFLHQRKRWASKAGHYERGWLVAMNVGFWLFFLGLVMAVPASIWIPALRTPVLVAWGIKLVAEASLLLQSLAFYRRISLIRWLVPAQPFQMMYILWVTMQGLLGGVEWKGRSVHR